MKIIVDRCLTKWNYKNIGMSTFGRKFFLLLLFIVFYHAHTHVSSIFITSSFSHNQKVKKNSRVFNHKRYLGIRRGGSVNGYGSNNENDAFKTKFKKFKMYLACLAIVMLWIITGTLFYSIFNNWPLPQSFFYAIDAGMSVGFCTDITETSVGSRAFTIVYILLGASCVGGALALFIEDVMEGIVELRSEKFEQLLAADAVNRIDIHKKGTLNYNQFRNLLEIWTNKKINDQKFQMFLTKIDPQKKGFIKSTLFIQKCHKMKTFLQREKSFYSDRWIIRNYLETWEVVKELYYKYRIYVLFVVWVGVGIFWGYKRQKWDIITATHFAISALATGGLTAPQVNELGILPTEPAIFCGVFCLFGIPLFTLTLGKFARVLVEGYELAAEEKALFNSIFQPLEVNEFDYAKHLCTTDNDIHLSDFIVFQLMRQGKIDLRTVNLMKTQFQILDVDKSGVISFENMMTINSLLDSLDS